MLDSLLDLLIYVSGSVLRLGQGHLGRVHDTAVRAERSRGHDFRRNRDGLHAAGDKGARDGDRVGRFQRLLSEIDSFVDVGCRVLRLARPALSARQALVS